MKVTQVCIGRFHHFHLARILAREDLLHEIWTGFPQFKLRNEKGIPKAKIRSFPWLQTPYMAAMRSPLRNLQSLKRNWAWLSHEALDRRVASTIHAPSIVFALSSSGLHCGSRGQEAGGLFICDRASSHIRHQDAILREEFQRWNLPYRGINPRVIAKEEEEYVKANAITVPSSFVKDTFSRQGVDPSRTHSIPYGANLTRFQRTSDPDPNEFRMLWVGSVSIRKGFLDALAAFNQVRHPAKSFTVIGPIDKVLRPLISRLPTSNVDFKGIVPNSQLVHFYNQAHVFVLPSLEEGMAYVQGEALACGCPVISTENAGANDLYEDGVQGFYVPIRSPEVIASKIDHLLSNRAQYQTMRDAAVARVQEIGGWDQYGRAVLNLLHYLKEDHPQRI